MQLQNVALKLRTLSFPISVISGIVLNAERKSTYSIRMQLFLFLSSVKTEWRAVDMAYSVDLSVLKAIPVRVRAGSDVVFDALENFDSALISLFSRQREPYTLTRRNQQY